MRRLLPIFLFCLLFCAAPALAAPAEGAYYSMDDTWVYTLTHEITVRNDSPHYAFDITVRVPLADTDLPLYNRLIGTQLDPYPVEIVTDENGHRTAVYAIDHIAGNSSVVLAQKYVVETAAITYLLDAEQLPNSYGELERQRMLPYLQSEPGIESDDAALRAFAVQNALNESKYLNARSLFSAVNLYLTYSDAAADQSAQAVFHRKTANCEGYARLYAAVLRSSGIPARLVNGYIYRPQQNNSLTDSAGRVALNSLYHAWVEFYLPETGWILADPTFTYTYDFNGQTMKFIDWSYFANIQSSRRYFFFAYGDNHDDNIYFTATGGDVSASFAALLQLGKNYQAFNDLENCWAANTIAYAAEHGYMNGVSADRFDPGGSMTRAMFVTVLARFYKARGGMITPYYADLSQFADVDDNTWYSEALGWALDENLVQGYGDGNFGTNDAITREQMATILAAFLPLLTENTAEPAATAFRDAAAISPWARDSVARCVGQGILNGFEDNTFRPQTIATRAQAAAILQRLDETIGK